MSKKLIAGLGTVAALGIAALPLTGVFAADNDTAETIVRVRVPTSVECSSVSDSIDDFVWLGNVAAGTIGSKAFSVKGSTNAAEGFKITGVPTALNSGTLDASLTESTDRGEMTDFTADGADSIAYATAQADDSWWITTEEATGVTIGSNIVITGDTGAERTFGLTANVKPGLATKSGLYQGKIDWTCIVNPD